MEAINSILSNDIGYLHALRFAQPLPAIIQEPVITVLPPDINKPINWGGILLGVCVVGSVGYFLYKKYYSHKKTKKN